MSMKVSIYYVNYANYGEEEEGCDKIDKQPLIN